MFGQVYGNATDISVETCLGGGYMQRYLPAAAAVWASATELVQHGKSILLIYARVKKQPLLERRVFTLIFISADSNRFHHHTHLINTTYHEQCIISETMSATLCYTVPLTYFLMADGVRDWFCINL